MILIDYSGVAIRAITGFSEDLKRDEEHVNNLCKHVIITSIKGFVNKFKQEYGNEVIIACDNGPYWRKEVFPYYKYNRKKNKEQSDIPWDLIFKNMDEVKKAIDAHFPWKVIDVKGAEADDIIAVMAKRNGNVSAPEGVLDVDSNTTEKTIIITSDKDASQLLVYPHVRIFSPRENKYVELDMSAKRFLRRLILTGDSGDGIPNVFSPIDTFYTGVRQKPATEVKMKPYIDSDDMLSLENDTIKKRILENTQLISFDHIPDTISESIMYGYTNAHVGKKMDIYRYLAENKMKLLMDDIDTF